MYRQGDVLILDAVKLPKDAVRRASNIVVEGEVTGHAHRLMGGEIWESGGALFVVANDNAALTHEEHDRVGLDKSRAGEAFPIIIQREYDDENEWRKVAD